MHRLTTPSGPLVRADLLPHTVQGLPFHPLLVHATVVLLPLTALTLVLCAFSARLRARAGIVLPLLGVVSLVLVPVSTSSGGDYYATLRSHGLPAGGVLARHQHLGGELWPFAAAMAVMTVAVYAVLVLGRRVAAEAGEIDRTASGVDAGAALPGRSPLSIGLAVLSVAAAVGVLVMVVAIGHLGAEAVYGGG